MTLEVCVRLGFKNLFIGYINRHNHSVFEALMGCTWGFDFDIQVALASEANIKFIPDTGYT